MAYVIGQLCRQAPVSLGLVARNFAPEWTEILGTEINEQTLERLYRHFIEAGKRYGLTDFHHAQGGNDIYTRQFGDFLLSTICA